jgi:magnesium-transporting ATPase (P-type)
LRRLSGTWKGIVPDKELHNFSSDLTLSTGETVNYYKDKQLLYRGARLKNTKWIYGLTIYTGRNSKIMMNSDSSSEKMSQIETKVNYILGLILLLQVVMCLILAVLDGVFLTTKRESNSGYIVFSSYPTATDAFLIFCSYMVLLNTMIPISLIVSIEIVKMSQSYFIDKDKLMYSEFRKKYCNVKSASLNEELGQI